MEFNTKLQQLRNNMNITQEQLAENLYVSRVTISKWESGRGYPNIDSLKLIAKFFNISIDSLLSTDELILIAENQKSETSRSIRALVFGIVDCMAILLFFIPCCGNINGNSVEVVVLSKFNAPFYILLPSYILVLTTALFGLVELVLQSFKNRRWNLIKVIFSLGLSILSVIFFILIRQPSGSIYLFFMLLLKAIILIKRE